MATLVASPRPTMNVGYSSADGYLKTEAGYSASENTGDNGLPVEYGQDPKSAKKPVRVNPHRKWSKQWIETGWDIAVEVGRWPRIVYFGIGLILVGAWIAIMLTFANEEVQYEKKNLEGTVLRGVRQSGDGAYLLQGTLRKFDPFERSLTVQWSFIQRQSDGTIVPVESQNNTLAGNNMMNLYRDVVAVPEDRVSPNHSIDVSGEYRIDNITAYPIAVLGSHSWDSVDTDIDFTQSKADDAWRQPLFAYPFDIWSGSIVFAATYPLFAQMAELNNTGVFGLADALLADSTLNWRISATANNTCILPDPAAGCELHIDFTGERPGLVKFAAIVAVIVNWTTTIGIFLITGEAVVMRRTYILRETDILGVCLTALFALPSVRAILPGAPDFGAIIDLIGIIPNIIIISLCTSAMAVSKLTMKPGEKEE